MGQQLILTHENTDFDGLASQLAASKLYPEAVPVLPRQINRNLRDFLTLYWERAALRALRGSAPAQAGGAHHPGGHADAGHPRGDDATTRWCRSSTTTLWTGRCRPMELHGRRMRATTTLLLERIIEAGASRSRRWRPRCWRWASTKTPAR